MAAIAAEGEKLLVAFLTDIGPLAVIGITKAALGRVLDEIERRRGSPCLAAPPPGGGPPPPPACFAPGGGSAAGGRTASSRLTAGRSRSRLILGIGLPRERTQSCDHDKCQNSQ